METYPPCADTMRSFSQQDQWLHFNFVFDCLDFLEI